MCSALYASWIYSLTAVTDCYYVPPAHLSFPTRRSSDLGTLVAGSLFLVAFVAWELRSPAPMLPMRASGARSEEHTSELQSRFDLVCRLLLEKKNKERT